MSPSRSISEPSGEPKAPTKVSVIDCWSELERYLERRSRKRNAEVRGYPTQIACCDDQLPKLLEQRARANEQLKLARAADAAAPSIWSDPWLEARSRVLAIPMVIEDDETESAIRARLR